MTPFSRGKGVQNGLGIYRLPGERFSGSGLHKRKTRRQVVAALRLKLFRKCRLYVVIQEKLVWMRSETDGVSFLALMADPHVNEVSGKDITFQQELVVFLQIVQSFIKAPGHLRHFGEFFRWQIVEIFIH